MRIAMWSGPRNLSTALMYSFGARSDMAVVDEPFYAAYLAMTGFEHPMRKDILKAQPTNPREVVDHLLGPVPGNAPHMYQKHMTQHMIKSIPRHWLCEVTNVFLIRHPARVVASFSAKYDNPKTADLGFEQQVELFDQLINMGKPPVVIDAHDIRRDPETMLRQLCDAIDLPWDAQMLSWPKGGHPQDGVWAKHWYATVHQSTGFSKSEGPLPDLCGEQAKLVSGLMPFYEKLSRHKITI